MGEVLALRRRKLKIFREFQAVETFCRFKPKNEHVNLAKYILATVRDRIIKFGANRHEDNLRTPGELQQNQGC